MEDISVTELIRNFYRENFNHGERRGLYGSSVGSNHPHADAAAAALNPATKRRNNSSFSFSHLFRRKKRAGREVSDKDLAGALMDPRHPTQGLEKHEELTLDLRKLAVGEMFDAGTFGRLFKGQYEGGEVAIKILERPSDDAELAQIMERQFEQEVSILSRLNHPNVVRFIGACRKPNVWAIVTEYAKGGSVRKFLDNRQDREMPLNLVVKQALDIARGMAYIHGQGLIHRDLKSANLLIAADRSIRIADFGVARINASPGQPMTNETGTFRWMSPEMMSKWPYTEKVDVYSFGIVLWELITGLLPFQEMDRLAVVCFVQSGGRPPIPNDCLPVLSEIMRRCWDPNPQARPSFPQIVDMLKDAEVDIFATIRKARFRSSIPPPTNQNI